MLVVPPETCSCRDRHTWRTSRRNLDVDQQCTHHVLGPTGGRDVKEAVLADIALRWVPAHLEGAGGRIGDLQALHSSQRLCQKQTTSGVKGDLEDFRTKAPLLEMVHVGLQTRVGAFTCFSVG